MDYFEAFERGLYALIQVVGFGFGALILVAISMVLTFLSGLIPSGSAGRKDPVAALRTE